MFFFGRKNNKDATETATEGANVLQLGAYKQGREAPSPSTAGSSVQQPPQGNVFAASMQASPSRGGPSAVIKEMARFPGWSAMVTGPSLKGALNVPVTLQDKLMGVRLVNGRTVVIYDPSEIAILNPRIAALRTELTQMGHTLESNSLACTPEIIKEVRLAAESKSTHRTGEVRSANAEQFKAWIKEARDEGATDVHMRIRGGSRGEIMMRVDGELEHLKDSKSGLTSAAVLECMQTAYETLADRNSNSDGNFSDMETRSCMMDSALGMPNLRLRFTSQRGFYGPKATIRLLTTETSHKPMSFLEMGFAQSHVEMFEKAQRKEYGAILQCGITGSGKTTAGKTFLETHPRNDRSAIYQVADPIEYLLRGVHQIYVQRSLLTLSEAGKKDPYTEVIESLMRMDPDMVDVGEIRDVISGHALSNVAKTGHLSLGTLHASSISGIMNRLTDQSIGLSRVELTASDVIAMLTYQALVGKLCKGCSVNATEAAETMRQMDNERGARYVEHIVHQIRQNYKLDDTNLQFKSHKGCEECKGRGTKGLTIIAEMMMPDDEWLDDSAAGKDRVAWRNYRERYSDRDLSSANMNGKTAMEHAIKKAIDGDIDARSIERFGDFEKDKL